MLHPIIIEDIEWFRRFLRGNVCCRGVLEMEGSLEVKDLLEAKGLLEAEMDFTVAFEVGECGFLRGRWEGNPPCEQRCSSDSDDVSGNMFPMKKISLM